MSQVTILCQEPLTEKPTYDELLAEVEYLTDRVYILTCAEQERDLAIAEVATCYEIIETLQQRLAVLEGGR